MNQHQIQEHYNEPIITWEAWANEPYVFDHSQVDYRLQELARQGWLCEVEPGGAFDQGDATGIVMKIRAIARVVNLTPHAINVQITYNDNVICTLEYPPSGQIARVSETRQSMGSLGVIPLVRVTRNPEDVTGLPEQKQGTHYIVSAIVAQAVGRDDLLTPGPAIRDQDGRIVGCEGLGVL